MQAEATTQPVAGLISIHTDQMSEILKRGISQAQLLTLCHDMNSAAAVILLMAGIVFLLWGFYAFKTLVVLNAAALGGWIGFLLGHPNEAGIAGAAVGAFVAAATAWPLMKYAVAIMGGLIGAMVGMAIWRTSGLDPTYAAAGGGMGLIFFGMISFILFRTSVMMFTSVQGAAMLTFGLLCLIFKVRLFDNSALVAKLLSTPTAVPMAILLAAILGMLYQNSDLRKPAEPAK